MRDTSSEHFDRISARYRAAAESWRSIYEQANAVLAPLVRDKNVLDIGNGGVFAYEPDTTRSTTVVDVSPSMLAGLSSSAVRAVVADARDLSILGGATFDVAVLMLVLHHIAGRSHHDTRAQLERVLDNVVGRLEPGGHLVVVEPVIRAPLRHLQRAAYPVLRGALAIAGIPMIYFQTQRDLGDLLASTTADVDVRPLIVEGSVELFGATFPGLLSLPPRLRPTDYVLFHSRKATAG